MTPQKLFLGAVLAAAALLAAAVHAPRASAATPCWKVLLTDWYDGRIDNTYPIHCYTDALKHLPPDVRTYSSAHDDIERALANAKLALRRSGKAVTPNTLVPPNNGGNPKPTTTETQTTGTTTTATSTTGGSPGKQSSNALDKLNPNSPSSLPLPLLILGGLALVLVAAGGAGLIAKRYQNRKPPPAA